MFVRRVDRFVHVYLIPSLLTTCIRYLSSYMQSKFTFSKETTRLLSLKNGDPTLLPPLTSHKQMLTLPSYPQNLPILHHHPQIPRPPHLPNNPLPLAHNQHLPPLLHLHSTLPALLQKALLKTIPPKPFVCLFFLPLNPHHPSKKRLTSA